MPLSDQYDGQNRALDCQSQVLPGDREAHTCIVGRDTNSIVLSRNNLAVPQEAELYMYMYICVYIMYMCTYM